MNEQKNTRVESFDLDHTKVKAPYVRMCSVYTGQKGDVVTKFDVRFTQPNKAEMQSEGLHTLEHLMATYLREGSEDFAKAIIDISPMGCRTGFYITLWNKWEPLFVASEVTNALKKVLSAESIPAENEIQCGNFCLHDLNLAKNYAYMVLKEGISDKVFG